MIILTSANCLANGKVNKKEDHEQLFERQVFASNAADAAHKLRNESDKHSAEENWLFFLFFEYQMCFQYALFFVASTAGFVSSNEVHLLGKGG